MAKLSKKLEKEIGIKRETARGTPVPVALYQPMIKGLRWIRFKEWLLNMIVRVIFVVVAVLMWRLVSFEFAVIFLMGFILAELSLFIWKSELGNK